VINPCSQRYAPFPDGRGASICANGGGSKGCGNFLTNYGGAIRLKVSIIIGRSTYGAY